MKHFLLFLTVMMPFFSYSQLHEIFSGSLITSNNPWEGNLDQFEITPQEELLFISPQGEAGEVLLSVSSDFGENMTWDVDVKLDFKSTTSNNARLIVYETSKISFYIQVGNNNGEISLYSVENGKATVRIKGRSLLSTEPYSYVSIRLTLKENKDWTLYTCKAGETLFTKEGIGVYSKLIEGIGKKGKLSLWCRYIGGRVSYFYFDNIHITSAIIPLPEITPVEPDEISEVSLLDIIPLKSNQIQFAFDNSVNIEKAIVSISELGIADSVTYGKDRSIVIAHFLTSLMVDKEYTISYKNIRDLSGKVLEEEFWEVILENDEEPTVEVPNSSSEVGTLLINEVMADPKGLTDLPETEYVELYNPTKSAILLDGWGFFYDTKGVQLNGFSISSNGYAVLYRGGREITVAELGQPIPLSNFPSALANTGKLLQLKDPSGKVIDEMGYPKATPALSWERLPNGDWHLSSDPRGGTPGMKNSELKDEGGSIEKPEEPEEGPELEFAEIQPLEIVFNELLPNPYVGAGEYIELYNRSKRTLSLTGLSVATRKSDGTLSTSYSLSSITSSLDIGGYALLTKEKEKVTDFYLAAIPKNIYEVKLPVLANTTSTLVLFRTKDKTPIDEITYSNKWHSTTIKDEKGIALERINPDQKTQDPLNWTSAASTVGYGTPGYKNSQLGKKEDTALMNIEVPLLNESGMYSIKYYLDNSSYNCRIYIFNMSGVKVAEIGNNSLLGTSGELLWNGCGFDGRALATGIYIFYAEVFSFDGIKKQHKKVFLVY